MKTLYLHVGPHKTGTTYIQNCLASNTEALAGRGIVYPATGVTPSVPHLCGHHEAVLWLAGKQNKIDAFGPNQLMDDIGEAETVILSSENACALSVEELSRIKKYFSGWNIRIVAFLRRRSAILKSQWQENVKWGEYYDISEFLFSEFVHPYMSNLVNQKLMLDKMSEVFGKESLIILNYDVTLSEGNDIADELLNRLFGPEALVIGSGETLNSSFPSATVDLIRVFNAAYRSINGVPRDIVRGIVVKMLRDKQPNPVQTAHQLIEEVAASQTIAVDISNMDNLFPNIERSILTEYKNQLPEGQMEILFPAQKESPISMVRIADLLFSLSDTLELKEIAAEYFPPV
jgi:hypothetical protein